MRLGKLAIMKQGVSSHDYLSDYKSDKSVGKALEEIAAGDVIIDPKSKMLERDAEKLDHKD